MGFFAIFFTILGVLLLVGFLRFFFRFLLPILIQMRALRRAQKEFFRRGQDGANYRAQQTPEGEVTVERTPGGKAGGKTIIRDGVGETVDYEEVD